MKKLKLDYLFVAAMVLGGGLAVANARTATADTLFYNNAAEGQPENWQPVPSGRTVRCDANPDNACTETRDESGDRNFVTNRGCNANIIFTLYRYLLPVQEFMIVDKQVMDFA